MKIVVVGGGASNVGKMTRAARVIRQHARAPTVAVELSVRGKARKFDAAVAR